MEAPSGEKILLEILLESAVRMYGEERTKALEPTLRDQARGLSAVEDYPLPTEEEPAFGK